MTHEAPRADTIIGSQSKTVVASDYRERRIRGFFV